MKKEILWVRELSCGHARTTNIAFISKIYAKPKVGSNAYCRECVKEVKIVKVYESDKETVAGLKRLMKQLK